MAIVVGVVVAVGGWLINEYFSRRAVRTNLRIEYLLSAYRRLDHASNREMTEDHEAALEEAISDIQLLGSKKQAEMAATFARQFAADRRADTEPLLDDLRASLRRELRLEPVPSARVWLRLGRGVDHGLGPAAGERSLALWQERRVHVAAKVRAAQSEHRDDPAMDSNSSWPPHASPFVHEMLEIAGRSPIGALVACDNRLSEELRSLIEADGASAAGLNLPAMAQLAADRSLINEATRSGIEGLSVMHTMALLDEGGRRLTSDQARDYVGLTEGLLLALRLSVPPAEDR